MPFRKALIWLKNKLKNDPTAYWFTAGILTVLLTSVAFLVDVLLPWNRWATAFRALVALLGAVPIFALAYGAILLYVARKKLEALEEDKEYFTWREKLSPRMRNRVAMVLGAVLFVFMYAVTQGPGYTFAASLIVAMVGGIFTFIRKTSQEINREKIGLLDSRDALMTTHLTKTAATMAERRSKGKKDQKDAQDKEQKLEEELEK